VTDNPKDPLNKATPPTALELFKRLRKVVDGFPVEAVYGAAANLIINSIRMKHATREAALKEFDELFGRSKTVLDNHYDASGRKKGIFPYDQMIHVPLTDLRDKS
jgi:hypothetical protein